MLQQPLQLLANAAQVRDLPVQVFLLRLYGLERCLLCARSRVQLYNGTRLRLLLPAYSVLHPLQTFLQQFHNFVHGLLQFEGRGISPSPVVLDCAALRQNDEPSALVFQQTDSPRFDL